VDLADVRSPVLELLRGIAFGRHYEANMQWSGQLDHFRQ
jgi:hypothetical protein